MSTSVTLTILNATSTAPATVSIVPPVELKINPSVPFVLEGIVEGGEPFWACVGGDLSAPGALQAVAGSSVNQTFLVVAPNSLTQGQQHTFVLYGTGGADSLQAQVRITRSTDVVHSRDAYHLHGATRVQFDYYHADA